MAHMGVITLGTFSCARLGLSERLERKACVNGGVFVGSTKYKINVNHC